MPYIGPSVGLLRRDRAGETHCWLNAAVMALFASASVRRCILAREYAPESTMVHVKALFERLAERDRTKPIDPAELLRVVQQQWTPPPPTDAAEAAPPQQDPGEFLTRSGLLHPDLPDELAQLFDDARGLSCGTVFARAAATSGVQRLQARFGAPGTHARHRAWRAEGGDIAAPS